MGFMRGTGRPICGKRDHIVGCVDNSRDGLAWSIVPAKGLRFGLFGTESSCSGRRRFFQLGGCVTLVLRSRRLDTQLDRIAQTGGNEVGFRAFP